MMSHIYCVILLSSAPAEALEDKDISEATQWVSIGGLAGVFKVVPFPC